MYDNLYRHIRRNITAIVLIFVLACSLTGCGAINEMRATQQMDLGNRYLEELKYEDAVVAFRRVIQLEDRNADAWLGLAEANEGLADAATGAEREVYYDQAVDAYKRVIDLEPQKSEHYMALADLYEKRGMPEEAIAVLESVPIGVDDTNAIELQIEELQEKYYSAEEPVEPEEETVRTPEALLTEFAEERTYLYGRQYSGYLSRIADSGERLDDYYRYDISEIPFGELGYVINDLDGDGQPELLIVGLSNEKIQTLSAGIISNDHTITLSVYESVDNRVELADEVNLADKEFSIEAQLTTSDDIPGVFDCYLYGDNRIGIEISDHACMLSDGFRMDFLSMRYDGARLVEEGRAWYVGSDGQYDGIYMNELRSLGIDSASWQDLFERYHYVRDYVTNYHEIVGVNTTYLISIDEYIEWEEAGEMGTLKCTEIAVTSIDEIAENTTERQGTADNASASVIDSGTYGGLNWTLYQDGTLTFSGNGILQSDRSGELAPGNHDLVRSIVFLDGVTGIEPTYFESPQGEGVFPWFFNVTSITVPASVEYIREAFWEIAGLEVICGYSGSAAEKCADELGVMFIAIDD